MQPQNITADQGVDREGAMAKADLYKLANYSLKLFKQLQDDDQMESWVQAKITKAADYIASVYHYLEYEMKFNDYGHQLDNAELVNEDQKIELKNKLLEAKSKIAELKKSQAEKMKAKDSKKVEEGILSGGEEPCTECGGTGMIYREAMPVPAHVQSKVEKYKRLTKATHAAHKRLDANNNGIPDDEEEKEVDEEFTDKSKTGDTFKTRTGVATKTDTGMKHNNTSYADDGEAEQKSGKGIKTHAKSQSAAEKKEKAPAQKFSPKKDKTWGMKDSEKFDNRDKEVDETYGQGVYQEGKKKGDGNLANNAKPYDKVTRGDVIAGRLGKDEKGGKDKKVAEALKGKQKNLDVDDDGDIEGDDLADLRAGKKKKVDEAEKTMSRAAKGVMKYGKKGMQALAKAGKGGKDLDKVRDKYNKYDESIVNEFDVKLYQPHEGEFNRGFGGSISGSPEVQAVIKTMQPTDYVEYNKYKQANPPGNKPNDMAWHRIAFSHKQRDEYNFVQRYNRDHNNLSIAQWLEKGKNAIKGAITGQPAEPVSYQSSRIGQGAAWGGDVKQGDEKAFPVNESAELDRMRVLMTRLNG